MVIFMDWGAAGVSLLWVLGFSCMHEVYRLYDSIPTDDVL
jgi:hypothetical protein